MWRGSIKYMIELPRTDNWYDMYIYIYKSAIVRNDLWSPLPGSSSLFQFSTNIWSQDSWQWKCALQSCSLFVFCSCDSIAFIQLDRLSILSNYLTQSFLFIEEKPSFFQNNANPCQHKIFCSETVSFTVCATLYHMTWLCPYIHSVSAVFTVSSSVLALFTSVLTLTIPFFTVIWKAASLN